MLILVSYDLPDDRRRTRLVNVLEDFGVRVQYSVFECHLDPTQWTILKLRLLTLFNAAEDSLRFYYLGANWRGGVEHHGAKPVADPDDAVFA